MTDVTMPQLGETVTEGTITKWNKAVGEEVAEDEVLFEVSTDKVDSEVPSPVSGTLTEIKVQEGATVEVGTVLCVIGLGVGAPEDAKTNEAAAPAPPVPPTPAFPAPSVTESAPALASAPEQADKVVGEVDTYDVVVIGGGPGGYAAALYGAASGLKVALVEKDKVGGTCLQRGCIPAKAFLETAAVYRTVAHEAKQHGITVGSPIIDFEQAQARKQKIIDGLTKGLAGTLKGRKITVIPGHGTLHPNKVVKVDDGTVIRGKQIVLATGSEPKTFGDFKIDGATVVTSNEVLSMTALPDKVAIVGGGVIGCEFASIMCDLGSKVTVLEGLPTILTGLDKDVAATVKRALTKRGVKIIENAKVQTHQPRPEGGTVVRYNDDKAIEVDAVVMCVGRGPLTKGLLADGTGVELDERGAVKVTDTMRTTADGVWAVGDCAPTPQLAHVGFAEAILAIHDMLGEETRPIDYDKVPCCVYTHPEAAWAGLTEAQAKERGYDVVIEKMRWMGNGRAIIHSATDGMVKIIAEKNADGTAGVILGVHMAGPWVTEQLGQAYLSVNWEATIDDLASLIQPHPSFSEVFGEAVMVLTGRGLHG